MLISETRTTGNPMRVATGSGAIGLLGQQLELSGIDRVAFVLDPCLPEAIVEAACAQLPVGMHYDLAPTPGEGEMAKTWSALGQLLERISPSLTRDSAIISLGGSTVGNVAGMCAALIFRGIALIHVPTTVMGQADGQIGLKQAVNAARVKNLYGTFHSPVLVLNDTDFLRSLPQDQFRFGFAEVAKAALAFGGELFDQLQLHARREEPTVVPEGELGKMIHLAAAAKIDLLEADPEERNELRLLEIGHTTAHALEVATDFLLHHGESVAAGVCIEARYARAIGLDVDADWIDLVHELFSKKIGLRCDAPIQVSQEQFESAIRLSNKRGSRGIEAVLPLGVGRSTVIEAVDVDELASIACGARSLSSSGRAHDSLTG